MQIISIIGLDIAKHVFQVHAADATGRMVAQVRLRRAQVLDYFRQLSPCLVGIEACATAHHWGRELIALGHEVRLMPPAYVRPYVKRNKTDATDAEAIAEAVTRPTMRFVPVKSADQQAMLMLHRTRELLVRQRTCSRPAFGRISLSSASSRRKGSTVSKSCRPRYIVRQSRRSRGRH